MEGGEEEGIAEVEERIEELRGREEEKMKGRLEDAREVKRGNPLEVVGAVPKAASVYAKFEMDDDDQGQSIS